MGAVQNFVNVSRRPPDIEDYIDILRRYRSWIIGPMFAGLVISVVVAFAWPDTYRSTAVMRISPPTVSTRLVPSEINTQIAERLNQMEQEILSRSSLSGIIQQPSLDLYKKERQQKPVEDIVTEMRNNAIQIKIMEAPSAASPERRVASAFSISFDYIDRYKAQAVVQQLVTKFMDQNASVQRTTTKQTTAFLDDELRQSKENLDDKSAKLTKFRQENAGRLPEQVNSNATTLSSLQLQAGQAQEALSRLGASKQQLETALSNYQSDLAYYSQRATVTQTLPGQTPTAVKSERLVEIDRNLIKARQELASLQKQYRDTYPLIPQLKAQIDMLEHQKEDAIKDEESTRLATQSAGATPQQIQFSDPIVAQRMQELKNAVATTKTNIASTDTEIEQTNRRIAELNRRIAEYQSRIDASPLNEQQYAQLLGDYNLAKADYDEKVKKHEASITMQSVEDHQVGERLEVLDPASLPEQSFEPKRPVWIAIGTAMGLMLGVVLAAAKEVKNTSLKNLKDVRAYTNLPVLSSIPLLENALLVRRKRRLFWLAWSSAFIVGSIGMAGSMYYHFFGRS